MEEGLGTGTRRARLDLLVDRLQLLRGQGAHLTDELGEGAGGGLLHARFGLGTDGAEGSLHLRHAASVLSLGLLSGLVVKDQRLATRDGGWVTGIKRHIYQT